jgi:hypothetical protein
MRVLIRAFAATVLAVVALNPAARAQDMTTATFNGTTIYVGGGVQFLSLPDIRFVGKGDLDNFRRQKNSESDWLDFGGAGGAGIETALGFWGGHRVTGAIKGFWANLDDSDTTACRNQTCIVVDPTGEATGFGPPVLRTKTDRDVDYWGGQAELKVGHGEPTHTRPNLYRNDYFIVGFDARGIDQDNKLRGKFEGDPIYTYKETLDTTYIGGYVGLGGEYSLNFLTGPGGIYDRLGLRTFISARAGLYNAETDYDGRFAFQFFDFSSRISQSDDELAFIGTVSLETRKQIGMRTSLSLFTDYEYLSSVPKMRYADGEDRPTRIDDEAVFASRTMLRLNIGFGPSQLYEEPLK